MHTLGRVSDVSLLRGAQGKEEGFVMAVVLCSFENADKYARGMRLSIARWQPRGGPRYPTLWFLAPFREDRTPIKMMPPEEYRSQYLQHVLFGPNREQINRWLARLDKDEDITLLCWCNEERQKYYPKLFCHSILVGYLIQERRPDIEVVFADGREKPVWDGLI